MHTQSFDITIKNLSKIEGHTDLDVAVKDGKVVSAKLRIDENKRFFTTGAIGKPALGIHQVVSRICGTCSIAHLLACINCVEDAFSVEPSEQTVKLRDLLLYGLNIRDHAHAPVPVLPAGHLREGFGARFRGRGIRARPRAQGVRREKRRERPVRAVRGEGGPFAVPAGRGLHEDSEEGGREKNRGRASEYTQLGNRVRRHLQEEGLPVHFRDDVHRAPQRQVQLPGRGPDDVRRRARRARQFPGPPPEVRRAVLAGAGIRIQGEAVCRRRPGQDEHEPGHAPPGYAQGPFVRAFRVPLGQHLQQ